jgi:alpha-galactosidase
MRYTDVFWTSDNTEAFDRLRIQEGFSQAYTAKYMSAWVTDVPNMNGRSTSLSYRFLVAMQGALGIGANLNKWSAADSALGTEMVAAYKNIRTTVQFGYLYRLISPRSGDTTANEYVAKDGKQAVLFAFRQSQEYNNPTPLIQLQGLNPRAVYRLESRDGKLADGERTLSGAYLMAAGVRLNLKGDFDAGMIVLTQVAQ